MQRSLELFGDEKEASRLELHTQSQNVLCILEKCIQQLNLKDLVHSLGADQVLNKQHSITAQSESLGEFPAGCRETDGGSCTHL